MSQGNDSSKDKETPAATVEELLEEALRIVDTPSAGGLVYVHPKDDGPPEYVLLSAARFDTVLDGRLGDAHDHVSPDMLELRRST